VIEVIIKKKKWAFGKTPSYLLNEKGKYCAAGFLCKDFLKIPDDILLNEIYVIRAIRRAFKKKSIAKEMRERINKFYDFNFTKEKRNIWQLSKTNDNPFINDSKRQFELKAAFWAISIKINFEN